MNLLWISWKAAMYDTVVELTVKRRHVDERNNENENM